jgi:ribosomal protein S18 acetylase RimI-like enzyme
VTIISQTQEDIPIIYGLYEQAIAFQKEKGYQVWNGYDAPTIARDIEDKRGFKIVEDDQIIAIFSLTLSDPIIWGEKDQNDAMYLHRVMTSANARGRNLVGTMIEWSAEYVKANGKPFLRLDTWAANTKIIAYYEQFGFVYLGNRQMPDSKDLPVQARNLNLALMERAL